MASASLYLDFWKVESDKPAPLKLRVYLDRENIKYYKTKFTLTVDEFKKSYQAPNPRGGNKDLKSEIEALKVKADKIIKSLGDGFTFAGFECEYNPNKKERSDIASSYAAYIDILEKAGRVGSADLYRLSLRSILEFTNLGKKKPVTSLPFKTVTHKFLTDYENWFIKEVPGKRIKSKTSVGIYLRNLRFIFNQAISKGTIKADSYPFGKGKYVIPAGNNAKKAIDNSSLKALYTADLQPGTSMRIARDYWFISYLSNGANLKDIASLKFKSLTKTNFTFRREKTKNTVRDEKRAPIEVPITEPLRVLIDTYANKNTEPENYVFPIFTRGMSERDKMKANRNFIRLINDGMQRLAAQLELDIKVGTMAARHSFTTKVTKDKGLEFAQQALGHTSLNTTQSYWAGFESEVKKEVANTLLDFD